MVSAISGGSCDVTQMWQNLLKKADTNGDGGIAKSEIQSMMPQKGSGAEEILRLMDANQDASISETEFEDVMSKLYVELQQGPLPSMIQPSAEDVFNTLDENGDGLIDEAELESVAEKSRVSVGDILSKLDTDEDGVIGKSEFEEALSEMRGQPPQGPPPQAMMGQSPEDIFNTIDGDGDGSITKDELSSFMAQNTLDVDKIFKEVDTNNDGTISRSESEAHMEKMKEQSPEAPAAEGVEVEASDERGWERMMVEMLLKAYQSASEVSTESTSIYV